MKKVWQTEQAQDYLERYSNCYKRITDGYGYDLGALVFDKEEPRSKKPVK